MNDGHANDKFISYIKIPFSLYFSHFIGQFIYVLKNRALFSRYCNQLR